ncbi:glycine zipper family protein [Donghicola sp. XS_ASV15]|uniref:glycine zipper family protein n=1 Tax=Donghicola sp. XS_ASV15 TaxID=3241295 RepID=UPI0035180162
MQGFSKHILLAIAGGVLVSACSDGGANYTPIHDGPTQIGFQSDLAACQRLAKNQTHLTQEAYGAAAIGAAAGALLTMAADDEDEIVGNALGGAAILGGTAAVEGKEKREEIVVNCMKGRGHAVVG